MFFFEDVEDSKVLVSKQLKANHPVVWYKYKPNLLWNLPVFRTICMRALLLMFHGYILPYLEDENGYCACVYVSFDPTDMGAGGVPINASRRRRRRGRKSYHTTFFRAKNS
jgi:hypothetical protein